MADINTIGFTRDRLSVSKSQMMAGKLPTGTTEEMLIAILYSLSGN